MARLPSRKELESMFPHNACSILGIHERQCLQAIENYGRQSQTVRLSFFGNKDIKRECAKLHRLYNLANELGHDIGQPDYRPQHSVDAEDRTRREMYQGMYEGDIIWRSVEAEQAAV